MTIFDSKPKNLSVWFLGALMFLIPIQYYVDPAIGSMAGRVSQQQVLQVVSLVLFSIFILNNIWLSIFTLWSIFLYAYFGFPQPVGVAVLTIVSGCLIYEAVYRIVDKDNIDTVFNFFIWFGALNLIYMVMQGFGGELLFREISVQTGYQSQMLGFMLLKAIMGMFFAMVIPFVAFNYPIVALGLFVPLYISECSSAMVAGIVAYLWQIWFVSRKWFFILLTIMAIGGTAYAINDSHAGMFTDRVNMWKTVLRDAVRKPIFGWGPDSFRCVTPDKQFMYWKNVRTLETDKIDVRDTFEFQHTGKYSLAKYGHFMKEGDTTDPWDNPHNEYVQLFLEFGIVGVIILGFLISDMKRRFTQYNPYLVPLSGFFIALAIMSIGQFPLHLARVGFFVPIFLACYYKMSEIG